MGANNSDNGRITLLRRTDIIHTYLEALHNAKTRWDYCTDLKALSVAFAIEPIKRALLNAKETRGIMIRFVTEITRDNIPYCKEIMKIGKVRHLDGVNGNFGISDTEYIATSPIGSKPIMSHAIYSNVREDLQQQHYIFEILWKNAIPAEQKIREIEEGYVIEKTGVLYGTENVIDAEIHFFSEAKNRIDTCMDATRPRLAIGIEPIRKSFVEVKSKGVQLRYLTEITNDNLSSCKEIMNIVDELRHLDGIKGNFMISENEYLAPVILNEEGKIPSQLIYSNVDEIVEQQHYIFETLWRKAIPSEQRIREIEEGVRPVSTRILEDQDQITSEIRQLNNNLTRLSVCSTFGGMQMSYKHFFDSYLYLVDKHQRGEGKGIRWIITIDKESIDLVKIFLNAGIQVRHVKNMPPWYFGVSDIAVAATIEKMEGGKMSQSFLVSNEPLYINHFNSLFDEIWKNGIDAEGRIKAIEEGVDSADVEVIPRSGRARLLYLELVKNAKEEILFMFPTSDAFIRQERMGAIPLAIEAAKKEHNVRVRFLVPFSQLLEHRVQVLGLKREEKDISTDNHNVILRYIEQASHAKATIVVVDRKASLVMELRDDSKSTFDEAIGLSTYSNSIAGVLSYVAMFENLWKQTELYEDVKKAHEQLKLHDKAQKEFINVAAHELRTPIQPILGLSHLLLSKTGSIEQYNELLETINRNAKRLNRLSDDILDATKIESKSLELKKERFNLNDIILNAMDDIKLSKDFVNRNVQLLYQPQDIVLDADKGRTSQVISNLLSNAIKFTKIGFITIATRIEGNNHILISVKDTGSGIDPEILPELFSKFTARSFSGTGLGLFISKSIVEAHGGKIWAENNSDGKGTTFTFSLPLRLEAAV